MPQPASKVLVLRLAERLEETLAACHAAGLEPLAQSYGHIVSRETTLPPNIGGLIISSSSALDAIPPTKLPLYCVGKATARRATAKGFRVAALCEETAQALAAALRKQLAPQALLHVCGEEAGVDDFDTLAGAGFRILRQTAYHIEKSDSLDPLLLWHLQQNQVTLGMVFSYQSGLLLRQLLMENDLEDIKLPIVAISAKAAKAFSDWPQVNIAEAPTLAAMIAATVKQTKGLKNGEQP